MGAVTSPMPYAAIIVTGLLIGALVEGESLTAGLSAANDPIEATAAVFSLLGDLLGFGWLDDLGVHPLIRYFVAVMLWLGLVLGISGAFT